MTTRSPRPGEQLKLYVSEHLRGGWDWRTEARVARRLTVPRLPRDRGVWAVSVVRDERDIVGDTVGHLLDQGVAQVVVADHMSSDGTRELLAGLAAADPRVHLVLDAEPGHFQKEKISRLARLAARRGASWVVPFDADEFWFAEGCALAEALGSLPDDVTVVEAATTHMVPLSDETTPHRPFLLDAGEAAAKVAFRGHPFALVGPGNHGVARVGRAAGGLHLAHVPYRSAVQLARKFRQGVGALDAAAASADEGWHWRRGASMDESETNAAWHRIRSGQAVPEVGWHAHGPMVRASPLSWSRWDPDGDLGGR